MINENEEVETINGFDIPKRELNDEEASRDITIKRIQTFHYTAGEDFLDSTGEGNIFIFCGWLMHKYPELSKEILEIANNKYGEIQDFKEMYEFGYDKELDIDKIYIDFAEFCNQTEFLKERVNQVLIQIAEYYKEEE